MMTLDYTAIVLALITMVSGWVTYWFDRRKHRQEVEGLMADNRQKDLDLSKDYVTEWRTYIAEPLTFVDLCRDSAKLMRAWLRSRCSRLTSSTSVATRQCLKASFRHCARCSIGYQREVSELRSEVAQLRHAIELVSDCPHRDACPVRAELQRQPAGDKLQ